MDYHEAASSQSHPAGHTQASSTHGGTRCAGSQAEKPAVEKEVRSKVDSKKAKKRHLSKALAERVQLGPNASIEESVKDEHDILIHVVNCEIDVSSVCLCFAAKRSD